MVGSVGQGVHDLGVAQGRIPAGTPAHARTVEGIDTHCCGSILRKDADSYSWTSCLNMKRFY